MDGNCLNLTSPVVKALIDAEHGLSTNDKPRIEQVGPIVLQRFAGLVIKQLGSGHFGNRLSGRRIPLAGRPDTGIDVRQAFGHHAYFQRAAGRNEFDLTVFPPLFLD